MDESRTAPCTLFPCLRNGVTVIPPTGARLGWGDASMAVSMSLVLDKH